MMKEGISYRCIRLGALVIAAASLLSLLGWMIQIERNLKVTQKFQDEFEINRTAQNKKSEKLVREYCSRYGPELEKEKNSDFSNLIVVEEYKLVYCSVPKVACTVWKRLLARLQGINVTNGVHKNTRGKLTILSNYDKNNQERILNSYTKFMFVREPFERLLSAYRDCFHGSYKTTSPYWKNYHKFVKDVLTRCNGCNNDTLRGDVTFEQFATFLVLQWRKGALFQEHWREQYNLCNPCQIQFDFIGHYETLAEDALFILRNTNLENKVEFPHWNPTDTKSLIQEYYSTLSFLRIKQLQTIYQKDAQLFGYSHPRSLEMIVNKHIRERL